jgi:O-antigen/teichoic acid export membrane protein
MRTKQSLKNISISVLSQVIIILLGFISRKVFIDNLGASYLGVNGLLTNVLSVLVLAESGIGITIVYNLYKPLADDNKEKIIALVQLYKKAYTILAIAVLPLSLAIYPFLGRMMKNGESIHNLSIVYFIFVIKSMISYLNAHKWSLINADQKGYIISRINLVVQIVTTISKIIVLVITQSYVLYLVIELIIFILQNIYNGRVVNKRYPYIKTKMKYSLDLETKDNIVKNVKAMFLHNIGGYCVNGTDNILISSFISVSMVGLYSNYTMIIGQLSALITPVVSGIGASVGNLIATEDSHKSYSIFNVTNLVSFWIYSFSVIFLYNLLEPFINWWLGNGYLLDHFTFIIILLNLYISGMRSPVLTFKTKAGIFVQDRYAPLFEAFINLASSIIIMHYLGLAGVFIGTAISTLSIPFWNQPRMIYRYLFKVSVWKYFKKYTLYVFITLISCLITTSICNLLIAGNSFLSLVARGIVCIIVPNVINIIIFYRTEEFQYLLNAMKVNLQGVKLILVRGGKKMLRSEKT